MRRHDSCPAPFAQDDPGNPRRGSGPVPAPMEKGRGLADLRGADPVGRRLEVEKKQRYAEALRAQIFSDQRRRESSDGSEAAVNGTRGRLRNSSSAGRVQTSPPQSQCSETWDPSSPAASQELPGSSQTCAGPAGINGETTDAAAVDTLSPPPLPESPTPRRSGCASVVTDANGIAEQVAQLQDLMRARLRSMEEEQVQQRCRVEEALQQQLVAAKAAAEDVVQSRFAELLNICSENVRNAVDACQQNLKAALAAVEQQHQEELQGLRSALHEQTVAGQKSLADVLDKLETSTREGAVAREFVAHQHSEFRSVLQEHTALHRHHRADIDELRSSMKQQLASMRPQEPQPDPRRSGEQLVTDASARSGGPLSTDGFAEPQTSEEIRKLRSMVLEQADDLREIQKQLQGVSEDTRVEEELKTLEAAAAQRHQQNLEGLRQAVRDHLATARDENFQEVCDAVEELRKANAAEFSHVREEMDAFREQLTQHCTNLQQDVSRCQEDAKKLGQCVRRVDSVRSDVESDGEILRGWADLQTQLQGYVAHQEHMARSVHETETQVRQLREDVNRQIGKLALRMEMAQRRPLDLSMTTRSWQGPTPGEGA